MKRRGTLLLHFIRKLIRGLLDGLLSLCSPLKPEDTEAPGGCGGAFSLGSHQFVSTHFSSEQFTPRPLKIFLFSPSFIFCAPAATVRQTCPSHQRDLHLLGLIALLLLPTGGLLLLLGWRGSSSHLQHKIKTKSMNKNKISF